MSKDAKSGSVNHYTTRRVRGYTFMCDHPETPIHTNSGIDMGCIISGGVGGGEVPKLDFVIVKETIAITYHT